MQKQDRSNITRKVQRLIFRLRLLLTAVVGDSPPEQSLSEYARPGQASRVSLADLHSARHAHLHKLAAVVEPAPFSATFNCNPTLDVQRRIDFLISYSEAAVVVCQTILMDTQDLNTKIHIRHGSGRIASSGAKENPKKHGFCENHILDIVSDCCMASRNTFSNVKDGASTLVDALSKVWKADTLLQLFCTGKKGRHAPLTPI